MFVGNIKRDATHLAEILMRKRWSGIFSERPVFITTDALVMMLNPTLERFGFMTPGTVVSFPLSPTRVLMIDEPAATRGIMAGQIVDAKGIALAYPLVRVYRKSETTRTTKHLGIRMAGFGSRMSTLPLTRSMLRFRVLVRRPCPASVSHPASLAIWVQWSGCSGPALPA